VNYYILTFIGKKRIFKECYIPLVYISRSSTLHETAHFFAH